MKWISVEKRLPEPYEKVLVYEKYMDDIPVTAYLSKNKIWVPYDEHFSVYGDGEIMNCFEQKKHYPLDALARTAKIKKPSFEG